MSTFTLPCRAGAARRRLASLIGLALACAMPSAHASASADAGTRAQQLADAQSRLAAHRRVEALALCEDILQRWPDDPDALRLRVRALSELGAAGQALYWAQQLRAPLPDAELAALHADLAAHQTRWARTMPADPNRPYAQSDRAVATLDDARERYRTYAGLRRRLDADRLVSTSEAARGAETIEGYRAMQQAGEPLPPYAEIAVADALMQQRQPEQAIPLYEAGIAGHPGPYADDESDPHISLAYAYLEAWRARDALALADRTAASAPAWLPPAAGLEPRPNPHKTSADIAAAVLRDNVWLHRDAWERLQALRAEAPANVALWRNLAYVERMRGWPRRSEATAVGAAGLDPEDTGTRLEAIDDWRELNDFARVEPALRDLEQIIPREQRVQLTRQAWDRQRGWQFDIDHYNGKGGKSTYGDYDNETEAVLQSPLLYNHWRVAGIARLAGGSLDEGGRAQRYRLGAGVRGYARGFEAYLQALPGIGQTRGIALESGFKWSPNDHWTFGADWSTKGDAHVPLRASAFGITAHSYDASAQWRASELTRAGIAASYDRFSDGNRRYGWQADLTQRLYTARYFTVDGGVQLGLSHNRLTDVPYYSPAQARWAMLTGRIDHMLYQRNERDWRHSLDAAIGPYNERGHGTGWAASVRYGQIFQPRGGLSFGWGVGWTSQPYDGKRESRVMLDLTLHWGQ
ncbi:poly-beta-1,6 N-acetyl-D-glucosamine export porin PgaA [Burkholderia singularis]|nr:poly-beta-1,6 N-acetyl-D-glucosamine export porin PgaA [Burkholderia singularis]